MRLRNHCPFIEAFIEACLLKECLASFPCYLGQVTTRDDGRGLIVDTDIEVTTADVAQSLVVDLVGDIGVLQQRVNAQHGVVRLDNSGGDLRAGPHGEGDLGLLPIVDGQTLHHEAAQTGTGTTTDGVVDHETFFIKHG